MDNIPSFQLALRSTRILRPPKHHLSTFGSTTMRYVLLSETPTETKTCRVREGEVMAERPQILSAEAFKERFSGFGDNEDVAQFEETYGQTLHALEYRFKNNLQSTSTEHAPLIEVRDRILKMAALDDAPRMAVLQGMDQHWSVSVMKFILDLTAQSFPGNVREMDERGMFDPEGRRIALQRRAIENLFAAATRDRSQIPMLGEALRSSGLFSEYEDRFFGLVNR